MNEKNENIKKMMVEIGRRIWERGFVAANDGNFSVRTGENEILATPTGVSKGFMTEEMIVSVDMDNQLLNATPPFRPSSEIKMHMEVYKQRPDVKAIVHSHPPYATSFAVAGIPLDRCLLPEAVLFLGSVPIAPYGTPSTDEIPNSIRPLLEKTDAILLANHGALTVGADLMSAYFKTETLEHSAKIYHLSKQLGQVNTIDQEGIDKLIRLRKEMDLPGHVTVNNITL